MYTSNDEVDRRSLLGVPIQLSDNSGTCQLPKTLNSLSNSSHTNCILTLPKKARISTNGKLTRFFFFLLEKENRDVLICSDYIRTGSRVIHCQHSIARAYIL